MPNKKKDQTRNIFIGTSGFSYPSWKNSFYPENLPSAKWFEHYCTRFNTVELNSTFYKFPVLKNLRKLYDNSPADFKFTIKAHKIITHTRRMKDTKEKIEEFMSIVHEAIGERLKCVLFQLPPSYKYSEETLSNILNNVAGNPGNVVEFRHESWWNEEAMKAFQKHNLSFCNASYPNLPESFWQTTMYFYLRMHGVPDLFKSSYAEAELINVAKHIPSTAEEVIVYFNNTTFDAGFLNALFLKALLEN